MGAGLNMGLSGTYGGLGPISAAIWGFLAAAYHEGSPQGTLSILGLGMQPEAGRQCCLIT